MAKGLTKLYMGQSHYLGAQTSEYPVLWGGVASRWPPGNSGASKGICEDSEGLSVWMVRDGLWENRKPHSLSIHVPKINKYYKVLLAFIISLSGDPDACLALPAVLVVAHGIEIQSVVQVVSPTITTFGDLSQMISTGALPFTTNHSCTK